VWTLNDGTLQNTPVTETVHISTVNNPPTLASVAASAHFTEEAGAVILANAVSVTDPDNLTLASATVQINDITFPRDDDVLAATTTGTSIALSYNSSTKTLALTGTDTLAHY